MPDRSVELPARGDSVCHAIVSPEGAGLRLRIALVPDDDMPVSPACQSALAVALLHTAGAVLECGGILVGHLLRNAQTPEICAEITPLIPATKARAGHAHLGFTPETWSAMSDALALRARQERMMGWFHAHPFFCASCPAETRARCLLSQAFFSREDQELHRLVFDAAFNVALLLSDTGEASLHYDLFGWRLGSIAARGCYVLAAGEDASQPTWTHRTSNGSARILNMEETDHETGVGMADMEEAVAVTLERLAGRAARC